MPVCFCCKSILPVYLSCPSSTLSNIGLFPPPPRSASFYTTANAGPTLPIFLRPKASKSLASAPSLMKGSRRCSDLPNFCHPTAFTFPRFWWYRVDNAQISTHFPLQFYDNAGSILLKIVTLLRKLKFNNWFFFGLFYFYGLKAFISAVSCLTIILRATTGNAPLRFCYNDTCLACLN